MLKFANTSIKNYLHYGDERMEEVAKILADLNPEYLEIYKEFRKYWKKALKVLTEEEIKLFSLKYVENFSLGEIADLFCISNAAVTAKYARIYKKLAAFYYTKGILFLEAAPGSDERDGDK